MIKKKYNYIYLQGRPRAVHVFIPKWEKKPHVTLNFKTEFR